MKASESESSARGLQAPPTGLLAGTALLALVSASCCVLPLGLSIVGLGGAWLVYLGPLVAWRVPILASLGLVLVWSWFSILRPGACRARRARALGFASVASVAFLVALTSPYWQGAAEAYLWSVWGRVR